jgi:hypothetical protein
MLRLASVPRLGQTSLASNGLPVLPQILSLKAAVNGMQRTTTPIYEDCWSTILQ